VPVFDGVHGVVFAGFHMGQAWAVGARPDSQWRFSLRARLSNDRQWLAKKDGQQGKATAERRW
jgi:hypothetical protein